MKEKNFKGILVAVPSYGGDIKIGTHSSISGFFHMLGKIGVPASGYSLSMCDVVDVRNCILTRWFDQWPEYDHLLMIDNDMQCGPDLLFAMIREQKPVTGVIYRKRQPMINDDIRSIIIGQPLEGNWAKQLAEPTENGFQKWQYVGGGVLMIQREVITKMLKQFPEINDTKDPGAHSQTGVTRIIKAFDKITMPDGILLSEDYSFCERWRRCGGDIWAAVDYPINHIGPANHWIHPAEALGLKKLEPEPQLPEEGDVHEVAA